MSLYQAFISPLLPERNTPHLTVTHHSYHHFLTVPTFMDNYYQGWSTGRVKFHQKTLTNALRAHWELHPLPSDQSAALESQKQGWWYGSRGWAFLSIFHYILLLCDRWQQREQSESMASDMEVYMKQRCVIDFLHAEKMAFIDIYWHLLNAYGDQAVDVGTVRWWVVCFSSGDSNSRWSPLVQIFISAACRLLFTTGENP